MTFVDDGTKDHFLPQRKQPYCSAIVTLELGASIDGDEPYTARGLLTRWDSRGTVVTAIR
jgi:hypothetical protein